MNLLIITQEIDKNADILGFFHQWVEAFALQVDTLYVLALNVGEYSLPENVHVYSMGKDKGYSRWKIFFNFHKTVSNLIFKNKIDSVFVHMCPRYAISLAPWVFLSRVPVFMWYAHQTVDLELKISSFLVKKIFTAFEETCMLKSRKIFVLGQAGINVNTFTVKRKTKNSNPNFEVLSVGRISPIKDYITMVRAANILVNSFDVKNIVFLIAGNTRSEKDKIYFQTLKELIKEFKLEKHFKFLGSIKYKDICKYYSECDLLVSSSRTDGAEKSILESMASGKPVIVCNKNFIPLFREYKDILIFKEKSEHELAEKLNKLLQLGEEKREEIGQTLRKVIVKEHRLERLIEKILAECDKFISKKNCNCKLTSDTRQKKSF